MSTRLVLKSYKYALFYFPLDNTLETAKTSNIVSSMANVKEGSMVEVNWDAANPRIPAKIIALADTTLELERVRKSLAGKESMPLTSEETEFVQKSRSCKRSSEKDTAGHQRKRSKKSRSADDHPVISKQLSESGRPPVTTELDPAPTPSVEGPNSIGRSEEPGDCPPVTQLSAVLETPNLNMPNVLCSQSSYELTPSALPATDPQMSSACTEVMFSLENFIPPSPEISMVNDDFLEQIVTCNNNSNHSLSTQPVTCTSIAADTKNTRTYSVLQPAKTNVSNNVLPSVPSFDILNTLPGGAHLSHINRGLDAPQFLTQPPPFTASESQSVILNTLALLLSNQQVIIEELKEIKQQMTTSGTVVREECAWSEEIDNNEIEVSSDQAHSSITASEVVPSDIVSCELPKLSDKTLFELKNKKVQAKTSESHFAVVLMNELSTREMRVGRSVYGTMQRQALDQQLVSKVREYYFKAYPCEEEKKDQIWKQCVTSMNNRLKKYDKAV